MKKFLSALLSLVMLMSLIVPSSALEYGEEWEGSSTVHTTVFKDVPSSHWAYENIMRVVDKGWFHGYPDSTFRPGGNITRAEAVTVFVQFLGMELTDVTTSSFYDVDVNKWYAPYIEAGKDLMPVHSTPSGGTPFQPDMPITREDTMYALVVALGYDTEVKNVDESVLNMFKDQNSLSRSIRPYVAYAVQNGLVSGKGDGTIGGQDPLTRAEFATLLYRGSMFGFNDTQEAKLQSVSVTPVDRVELKVGESFNIEATAVYSDKTSKAYTGYLPYNSDDNGVVSINGGTVTGAKVGNCVIKFKDDPLKNASIVVIVTKDAGTLTLDVNEYENPTYESYATISGTVKDSAGNAVTLSCNGRSQAVEADGSFEILLPLELGVNTVELAAANETGNAVTKSFTILRRENVTEPDNGGENAGTLLGLVCKASDHETPVPNASVRAYNGENLVRTATSGSDGSYSLSLPGGHYRLDISADGYIPLSVYVDVPAGESVYMETFLMIEGSEGDEGIASGTITNALTGQGLGGVALSVRPAWNSAEEGGDVITTAITSSDGRYSLTLPVGGYTVSAEKAGFIPVTFNVIVQRGTTGDQNASMTPILDSDTFRIVLTWGEHPRDLDSHMVGTLSNGNRFHVYFSHKSNYDGEVEVCNLDVDDVTSYGPETVTLVPTTSGAYYYYIHRYAGISNIAASGAQIKVYNGNNLLAVFNAPVNQGTSDYWNVFALINGEIVIKNTITTMPDTTYAG